MSRLLDSVSTSDASLGPYYEQKLRVTLANVWRHKLLVLVTVAVALVIGIALALAMPKQYTAEAYLRWGFDAKDAIASDEKSATVIALDASQLIETRARLLRSQQVARQVVERLGLERLRPVVSESLFSSWLRAKFYGDVTRTTKFQEDMAAEKLLSGLSVKTEPRVYLITVLYTARDPEFAALITNVFVAEFLKTVKLQSLAHQRELAQRKLTERLATLGEKHPKVLEAKERLEAADALLRAQSSRTEEIKHTGSGNVTFAQATTVASSPNPLVVIGLALLVGLMGGIAMAAFRGRRWELKGLR